MAESNGVKNIRLRGVKVADTRVSHVDGTNGVLIYRGYRIEALAENSTFEETAFLLHYEELPMAGELEAFTRELVAGREVPGAVIDALRRLPATAAPMDVLQAAVPMLATADTELLDDSREANQKKAAQKPAKKKPARKPAKKKAVKKKPAVKKRAVAVKPAAQTAVPAPIAPRPIAIPGAWPFPMGNKP